MATYTFSLASLDKELVETNLHFSNAQLFAKITQQQAVTSVLPGEVEVYSSVFQVNSDRKPTPDILEFDQIYIPFSTSRKPQTLHLNTDIKEIARSGNGRRFRIIGVDSDRPDLIDVMHRQKLNDEWVRCPYGSSIDDDTKALMVQFQMSGDIVTPRFSFWLIVTDADTGLTIKCDPQVGNNPPGKPVPPAISTPFTF